MGSYIQPFVKKRLNLVHYCCNFASKYDTLFISVSIGVYSVTLTRRSHTPRKWEECGGLKNHTTPLLRRHSFTGTSSHQRSKRWGWTRMRTPHWSDQACPWFHAVALKIPPESLMHKLLTTFLAQTSAILNNRPLIPVSTDPEDPLPLGPSLRRNNIHGKSHSN